jgi:hypothetical protein
MLKEIFAIWMSNQCPNILSGCLFLAVRMHVVSTASLQNNKTTGSPKDDQKRKYIFPQVLAYFLQGTSPASEEYTRP